MKLVKRILLASIAVLILLSLIYLSDIIYGIRQLNGQLSIINGAVDIKEYLADPANPDSIKNKLLLVERVKEFAIKTLEYKPNDNYTTVFDQKGEEVLWVVTASLPYKLEPKIWSFPFLGEVSYKGHFNLERTINEAKDLEKNNWDVSVRAVNAWSTLGWFNDPILTGMLDRTEGELAELILHELTHGELFVKDSVDFNENLASFIGEKAAASFLIQQYGDSSTQLINYLNNLNDQRKISNFMLVSASKLDSLYNTFSEDADTTHMASSKSQLIEEIISNLDTVSFSNKEDYIQFFSRRKPNNAHFMSFIRYKSMENEFEDMLQTKFKGDLKSLLDFFRTNYPSL